MHDYDVIGAVFGIIAITAILFGNRQAHHYLLCAQACAVASLFSALHLALESPARPWQFAVASALAAGCVILALLKWRSFGKAGR